MTLGVEVSALVGMGTEGGVSVLGVDGWLDTFASGPCGSSSDRSEDKSTVSKNEIAASRFTRQYAASPSTLLEVRKR